MEEFLQNNKDKLIPLCMLEPTGKKRRHPIHQKKREETAEGKKSNVNNSISFRSLFN